VASPKSRPRDGYPGRALSLILVVAVVLVATMFATGNKSPRLGVDLAGGTTMTLTAQSTTGSKTAVNSTSMNEAASIIQERVNGTGVTEGTVQVEGGNNIVVTVPKSTNTTQLEQLVGTTAKLYFRPVLATAQQASAAAAASAAASSSASATPTKPATPSGSPSSTVKATGTSTLSPKPTASKTQGDAVTGDLKASGSPSAKASDKATGTAKPTATAGATPAASPSTNPTTKSVTGATTGTVPASLTTQFNNLDCTNTTENGNAAALAGADDAVTKDVVACEQNAPGVYTKYALAPVSVNGTDVSSASAVIGQSGEWQVNLTFDSKGSSEFASTTAKLYANVSNPPTDQFAIVLDGTVQSAPAVDQGAITGGTAQISGSFNQQSATQLANQLSYGALPLTFKPSDVTTVSPQLGGSQLTAGLIAGAIGLALVILYCLIYYRALGLVAVSSLGVSAVLTYSIMSLLGGAIGFALNLPAVCGAIVAIGITADSFVVYFERIRDEVRLGSSLRPAVQRAWPRARRTILVSDFVSFLAAAVLYFFTVGKVQGFAFTLGLTTLLDIVVIFLFTKPLITLLARTKFFSSGHAMSGLSPERLGARSPLRDSRRRPTAPKEA
jgi:preprotein translocase subunit SecD